MDQFIYYAPIVIVVLVFLVQERIVVTPEQLEKKHREIIKDIEKLLVLLYNKAILNEQEARPVTA